jgi:hypothetical protein
MKIKVKSAVRGELSAIRAFFVGYSLKKNFIN